MPEVKAAASADDLKFVSQLTKEVGEATRARVVSGVNLGPRKVLLEHKGELVEKELPPPPRAHTATDVASFVAAVLAYQPPAAENAKAVSAAWVSPEKVVGLFDVSDRNERVTLPLQKSHIAVAIERLVGNPWQSQKELIALLRGPLAGVENCEAHLLNVRSLKFEESTTVESNVQRGRDTLGMSAHAAVTGANELPDTLEIEYAIYTNSELRSLTGRVRLLVDTDISGKRIGLTPQPDDLEEHRFATLAAIAEKLRSEFQSGSVDVFAGTP